MADDIDALLRSYRKKPLFEKDALAAVSLDHPEIQLLIPHRPPYLLIDCITHVSYQEGLIAGNKTVRNDDPYLSGHFPGNPLYPGMLILESIGQLALSLYYFVLQKRNSIAPVLAPPTIVLTKLLGAYFLNPVRPTVRVTLLAKNIDYDGLFARAIGQALVGTMVCAVMAGEVYITDN